MTYSSADVIWTLVAAAMVYFMQAGFAMCEAGMTRAKNTGNILMKNMMDFCIGTPIYWLIGFGIMFGGSGALIGGFDPLIRGTYDFGTLPTWCYVIFQTVFCATAATIVSGSYGRENKFRIVLSVQFTDLRSGLSDLRSLDLGRRLACAAWLP